MTTIVTPTCLNQNFPRVNVSAFQWCGSTKRKDKRDITFIITESEVMADTTDKSGQTVRKLKGIQQYNKYRQDKMPSYYTQCRVLQWIILTVNSTLFTFRDIYISNTIYIGRLCSKEDAKFYIGHDKFISSTVWF